MCGERARSPRIGVGCPRAGGGFGGGGCLGVLESSKFCVTVVCEGQEKEKMKERGRVECALLYGSF